MTGRSLDARWEVQEEADGRTVRLTGHWNLLARLPEMPQLSRALTALGSRDTLLWDLEGVETLDSTGALLLWQVWGQRLPARLRCHGAQRKWFERLADLPTPTGPPPWHIWQPLEHLGKQVISVGRDLAGILLLVGQLIVDAITCLRRPRLIPWKEISANIYQTGATSLPLLGVIGFLIGVVMTYQLAMSISRFGANTLIINLLGLSMLRELGPVITAIILVGRSGSAITAGIGTMHVTEEFDALRAFGISPTLRLVLPKVVGMMVSVSLLVVWTEFTGLFGGIVTAQASLGVGHRLFLQRLPSAVPWVNFWIGLAKGALFGFIIATVSSYFGLKCRASTESLSRQTTNAVVTGLALIITLDAISGALLTNVGL